MDIKSYILLINREKKFLATIRQSLLDAGYPVLTTTTMSHALNLLSTNSIRLIICDSALEDFSGYEFLRFLKKNPLLEKIPFVFYVPVHDQGSAGKAFELGATDFIVYPLDGKIFIERIGEILSSSGDHDRPSPALPKENIEEHSAEPVSTSLPEKKARRESERITPKSDTHIEISRDAILWVPGQIMNINMQGILIETPLLGRLGMLIYIRVPLPHGKCVIESQVKHITISNHQLSADIGVEIEDSLEWTEVYNYITGYIKTEDKGKDKKAASPEKKSEPKKVNEPQMPINTNTVMLMDFNKTRFADPLLHNFNDPQSDKALEIRFYQSLVGKQLGNYKAVSFIGAGTMGGVFKGWDIVLERNVALKVISYKLSSIASFREMFVKEARFISRLSHPNIAEIYYIDQTDDVLYFAMELINGNTLADMIKESNNLNTSKGLECFLTTCRTLDFVSRKNIIHRDIKPENIMIDDKGILKVVDFGVAIVNDGKSKKRKSEGLVGSPLYVSPDCIMGQPLDSRSDIYSLGATFYHLFSGFPPFEGEDMEEVLLKHLNEDLVPLRKKNPTISVNLSDIIEKMMAKKPENRYQSYQAIIDDLDYLMS
ncbi:MAG: protein kinase [Deltaproteobacteria bacterium]|nr:protein kinase [Deltaproteobacteria bacterium]